MKPEDFSFFYTLLASNAVFRWGIQKGLGRSRTQDHMQNTKTVFRNIITNLGIPKWQYGISELVKVMWSTDKLKGVQVSSQWALRIHTDVQLLHSGPHLQFLPPKRHKWKFYPSWNHVVTLHWKESLNLDRLKHKEHRLKEQFLQVSMIALGCAKTVDGENIQEIIVLNLVSI